MKIFAGTVVGGKVALPSDALADGSPVAILATASPEAVHLTAAEGQELTEAVEAICRGEYIDGAALLAGLRSPSTM